ncbi:MAG: PQQ-binding-like beta-propeller repeat protein [Planctomycetes bacterium]|nr:PQQ-binding-like beta-propeller repeat protein [Planctomycetota bacterium]
MTRILLHLVIAASLLVLTTGADWRQFRGNDGSSTSADTNVPLQWSAEENIAWKADLPGRAASGPIVVKGRVVVLASSGVKQDRLHVLCIDARSGKRRWHRQFWATGRTLTHPQSAVSANTPASDGERIFAFYSSNDLICLDLDGNLLWYRGLAHDYPKAGNDVGMAASPVVVGKTVVVQIENQGDSFAAGINTETGETRWRIKRAARANWCSPISLAGAGAKQDAVLLQSGSGLVAVDAYSGKELWTYKSDCQTITSSVAKGGRLYVPSGGIKALRIGSSAAPAKLLWKSAQLNPGAASPVVGDHEIYVANRAGVVTCADLASGKVLWKQRFKGPFWATPVLAGNHLYLVNFDGQAQVVTAGRGGGKLVSTNELGEEIQGSPAVADGALYVRNHKSLWKIAKER